MPGTWANPVRLDPANNIVEVGWSDDGAEWVIVERYIPYVTVLYDVEDCDNGPHTPGDGGTHFPMDGSPGDGLPGIKLTSHRPFQSVTWESDEADVVIYALKANGEETFFGTDPEVPATSAVERTYGRGDFMGATLGSVRVAGGTTATIPSYLQDWLDEEVFTYGGTPPVVREGTSFSATRYFIVPAGSACWSGIGRPDEPGFAAAVIYWSQGMSLATYSTGNYSSIATDETFDLTLPADPLIVPADPVAGTPETIFDPFGYTTEESLVLPLGTDVSPDGLTSTESFRVLQIYRRRAPTASDP